MQHAQTPHLGLLRCQVGLQLGAQGLGNGKRRGGHRRRLAQRGSVRRRGTPPSAPARLRRALARRHSRAAGDEGSLPRRAQHRKGCRGMCSQCLGRMRRRPHDWRGLRGWAAAAAAAAWGVRGQAVG